jgi:hypothetical protein
VLKVPAMEQVTKPPPAYPVLHVTVTVCNVVPVMEVVA